LNPFQKFLLLSSWVFLGNDPSLSPTSTLGTLGSIFLFKSKLEIKFEDDGTCQLALPLSLALHEGFFTFKLALKGKSCVPFHLSSKG
jgi:hypothetical protein